MEGLEDIAEEESAPCKAREPLSLYNDIKLPQAEKFEQDQLFMEAFRSENANPARGVLSGGDFERKIDEKLKLVAEKVLEKKVLQEHCVDLKQQLNNELEHLERVLKNTEKSEEVLDREEKRRAHLQQATLAIEQQLAEVRKRTITMR